MFSPCRTCAECGVQEDKAQCELQTCSSSDEERALKGTWVTPELHLAIEMGYTVMEVYEVYHYEHKTENTYDAFTGQKTDLFGLYMNLLLKLKTASSGYPTSCKTEEQRREFVQNYESVIIAAFVTAYGRIKLYSLLVCAGPHAMYADTHSLIYRVDSPDQSFELGEFLGQLNSHIPEVTTINTFLTTGPKSYTYVLSNGESVLKYKGLTLSLQAREVMNVASMTEMICNF